MEHLETKDIKEKSTPTTIQIPTELFALLILLMILLAGSIVTDMLKYYAETAITASHTSYPTEELPLLQ